MIPRGRAAPEGQPEVEDRRIPRGFVSGMIAYPLWGDLDIDSARQPIDEVGLLNIGTGHIRCWSRQLLLYRPPNRVE